MPKHCCRTSVTLHSTENHSKWFDMTVCSLDLILEHAKEKDVAFLVVGDPFG